MELLNLLLALVVLGAVVAVMVAIKRTSGS